jgi:urea carboxylase
VEAPFAATVWRVDVTAGQRVEGEQSLVTLEAMKTEARIPAPAGGKVVEVLVSPGDQVAPGTPLVVLG